MLIFLCKRGVITMEYDSFKITCICFIKYNDTIINCNIIVDRDVDAN